MTRSDHRSTIQITADGQTLAEAELHPTEDPRTVHSTLHPESGHLPPGTRTALVDAVLDHPDCASAGHLVATMPLGDTEMLDRVRERCDHVEAHAAGATKIVEADLESRG